jgi:hypothetical protein
VPNLVGRVNFTATLDGRGTERDAENIGRKAGAAAGEGYDKTWQKSFRDSLTESGKRSFDAWQKMGEKDSGVYGTAFTKRFGDLRKQGLEALQGIRLDPGFLDDFAKKFDDAGLAAGELQKRLNSLQGTVNSNALNAARAQVDEWADAHRRAAIEVNNASDAERNRLETVMHMAVVQDRATSEYIDSLQRLSRERDRARIGVQHDIDLAARFTSAVDKVVHSTDDWSFSWKELSHNTRQWTLIIGAVMAGMEDIAVLGSAAGAGIMALGGAAQSAIIGVGGIAAVIVTLGKDLEDLPADLRPVVQEFNRFKGVFGELRETIARGAFSEMVGDFDDLGDTLRSLNPALGLLGKTIGEVFSDLVKNTRPGTKAFEEINKAILLARPNLKDLADTTGIFGRALITAFNRAQPLVEDMFDWLGRLARQFDDFTNSRGFDEWMRNAQRTFESLGPLLDAVGRGLNDLVNPGSVTRTKEFLDNLTEFVPNLTKFLDVLGRLDLFGLLAKALNEFGQAMEPLGPAAADLAEQLSRILALSFEELGDSLGVIAQALAPAVQMAADFLAALPEDTVRGLANGVLVLAGAFVILKGAQGLMGTAALLKGFASGLDDIAIAGGKAGGVLATLGRISVVGAIAGTAVFGVEALARAISESLLPSAEKVQGGFNKAKSGVDLFNEALKSEGINNINTAKELLGQLGGAADAIGKATWFAPVAPQFAGVIGQLGHIDDALANLATTDLPAASQAFMTLSEDAGLTAYQQRVLLDEMTAFSGVLTQQGIDVQSLSGAQELLAASTAETAAAEALAAEAARVHAESLAEISGGAYDASGAVSDLADTIRGFSSTTLDAREANRQFEQAFADLSQSVIENGTALGANTAEGRANEAALDEVAKSTIELAAATVEQTGKAEDANRIMEDGRQRLLAQMGQFGLTGQAAEDYVNMLLQTPEDLETAVALTGVGAAEAALNTLTRARTVTIRAVVTGGGGAIGTSGSRINPLLQAAGGVHYGPTHAIIGEAGPEAVVPLDRPLSMVDESVRWLSAIAQGKGTARMASGGVGGGGGGSTVEAGAIVVHDYSGDSRRTANEVVTRLIERVKG